MAKNTSRSEAPAHTVTRHEGLSFYTHEVDKRGRSLSICHFDVPAEEYGPGNLTGLRVAAEFMQAIQDRKHFDPVRVIEAACLEIANRGDVRMPLPGRVGAAVGFLRAIETMLQYSAAHADHQGWMRDRLAMGIAARDRRECEKIEAGRQFAERMREARKSQHAVRPEVELTAAE